jgi:transcriptional regulator with XRE-family HTH domain
MPMPTERYALPEAIKAWRNERKLTQERVAALVGVSPGMIALIETDRRQPGVDLLRRIAAVLEVPTGAIAVGDWTVPDTGTSAGAA